MEIFFKKIKGDHQGSENPEKDSKDGRFGFSPFEKRTRNWSRGTINPCPSFGQVQEKRAALFFFVPTGFPATGPAEP
jgi:hypothetical protein